MENVYTYQSRDPPGVANQDSKLECLNCHMYVKYVCISHHREFSNGRYMYRYSYRCPCNKNFTDWVTVSEAEFIKVCPELFKSETTIQMSDLKISTNLISKLISRLINKSIVQPTYLYVSSLCSYEHPCKHYVIAVYRDNNSINKTYKTVKHGTCTWQQMDSWKLLFPQTFNHHGTVIKETDINLIYSNVNPVYQAILKGDYSLLEKNVTL